MESSSNTFASECPECENRSFEIKEIIENSKTILVRCCTFCDYEVGRQENYTPYETDDIVRKYEKLMDCKFTVQSVK